MDWKTVEDEAKKIFDQMHQVQVEYLHFWLGNTVFSLRWFLSLAMLVIPWTVWLIVRKRGSEGRLVLSHLWAGRILRMLLARASG